MASPEPATRTPSLDDSERLHVLLARLRAERLEADLGELYDLTSSVVYSWALANTTRTADGSCSAADEVTVTVYTHLWRWAPRYTLAPARPWPWLQAALLSALREAGPVRRSGRADQAAAT